MSALRSINLLLKPFRLRLERNDKVGLTYPRPNLKLSLLVSALWTLFAFYLASYFSVDPRIGERSAECLVEKATSNFSVLMCVASLAAPLAYFVMQHDMGRITPKTPVRWFLARFMVGFSLLFSTLFSKLGAISLGVGIYATLIDRQAGGTLIAFGALFLFVGLPFTNYTLPTFYAIGPRLSKFPLAKSLLVTAAAVVFLLLVIGSLMGEFTSNAKPSTGCHLVIRYE